VLVEKGVKVLPHVPRVGGVDAVEAVSPGRVVVDLVLEGLARGLEVDAPGLPEEPASDKGAACLRVFVS
jgi:hypothetical protein